MEMREFASHDWSAFAGAEAWHATSAEGALPLIADGAFVDGMSWVLVLDRNGGCLVCEDEQAESGGYALVRTFLSAAEARAFATGLGEPKTRGEFFAAGFKIV